MLRMLFQFYLSQRQPPHILDSKDVVEKSFPAVCYTDGRKIDNEVGFAYVIFENGVEINYKQFCIKN